MNTQFLKLTLDSGGTRSTWVHAGSLLRTIVQLFAIKCNLNLLCKGKYYFACIKFEISAHPDLSRSILARSGSENHSGSEGWR